MINYEIELDLSWAKDCVLIKQNNNIASVNFAINSTKLYVPVLIFSINDNVKLLENIKQGFKRTIFWNKYRSEITTQPKNNSLDYLIDPTFRNINRLFELSFKNDQPLKTKQASMKNLLKCQEMVTIQKEIYWIICIIKIIMNSVV